MTDFVSGDKYLAIASLYFPSSSSSLEESGNAVALKLALIIVISFWF